MWRKRRDTGGKRGGNLGATMPTQARREYNADEAWILSERRISKLNQRDCEAGAT